MSEPLDMFEPLVMFDPLNTLILFMCLSMLTGSESGEQQLMVNSFLWNPFLSGHQSSVITKSHFIR